MRWTTLLLAVLLAGCGASPAPEDASLSPAGPGAPACVSLRLVPQGVSPLNASPMHPFEFSVVAENHCLDAVRILGTGPCGGDAVDVRIGSLGWLDAAAGVVGPAREDCLQPRRSVAVLPPDHALSRTYAWDAGVADAVPCPDRDHCWASQAAFGPHVVVARLVTEVAAEARAEWKVILHPFCVDLAVADPSPGIHSVTLRVGNDTVASGTWHGGSQAPPPLVGRWCGAPGVHTVAYVDHATGSAEEADLLLDQARLVVRPSPLRTEAGGYV